MASTEKNITHNTVDTIPLIEAENFTGAWRGATSQGKATVIGGIKGFYISKEDIDQLSYFIPQYGGCRAYFGIDALNNVIKFMMVPVDDDGKDILHVENGEQSTIFDFTRPCPTQCDTTSRLYGPQRLPDPGQQ